MQFPKTPQMIANAVTGAARQADSAAPRGAEAIKSGSGLPNVSAPTILLPPGVRAPARTITGMVPSKIRDLARYGVLAQQKVSTARRAVIPAPPSRQPILDAAVARQHVDAARRSDAPVVHKPLPNKPVTAKPAPPRTQPIFGASAGQVTKGERVTLKPGQSLTRTSGDNAMAPTGTPAFAIREPINGQGGGITRGSLMASDDGHDVMTFEYNPEEVSVDHGSGWIVTDQPGRAHPFIQFGGGGQRRISFQLRLFYTHNEVGDVLQNVNWLHSFLVGQEQGAGLPGAPRYLHQPKSMRLNLGDLFPAVPCILLGAAVTYKTLFRPDSLLPLYAEVQLNLLEIGGAGAATTYTERRENAMTKRPNAQGL